MQEPESRYTIAWMSDTQHYSNRFPDIFYAMTAYLRDAEKELNLKYVAHTGDLINNYGSERQWENAVRAMASIANIPAGVCAGNHDVKHDDALYDNFSRYFGEKQSDYRECYGGSFQDNRGHYDLIDAGSTRYLFIYMGYHVEQDGIEWIKSVLEQYPDRVAVLCTHAYFDTDLTLLADGSPERTVFHSYAGDAEMVAIARDNGWYLSFSGTVSYKGNDGIRESARLVGLDHIMVETDAPYLTPVPYRGRTNAPYMIPYTLTALADVFDLPVAEVARATRRTTRTVYGV